MTRTGDLLGTPSAIAVVLGGYVNGYGIIRSLHDAGVRRIHLIDDGSSAASWSRYLSGRSVWDGSEDHLVELISGLTMTSSLVVPFPTNDWHVEVLANQARRLGDHVFLPLNESGAVRSLNKSVQYEAAKLAGLGVPNVHLVESPQDLSELCGSPPPFPLLVKPVVRGDLKGGGFRNLVARNSTDWRNILPLISSEVSHGNGLLISELIPGRDSNIYAYTCYRARSGAILREWGGRKLSQYPDSFGVYSSASNETVPGLIEAGRALVQELDLFGIVEPEFKLDPRDGELKLMEVNLRSMMWHRTGAVAGVNLPEAQWLNALGEPVPESSVDSGKVRHVYASHEVGNLIGRKGYCIEFVRLMYGPGDREWAFWNLRDPGPFIRSWKSFAKVVFRSCQSRFKRS